LQPIGSFFVLFIMVQRQTLAFPNGFFIRNNPGRGGLTVNIKLSLIQNKHWGYFCLVRAVNCHYYNRRKIQNFYNAGRNSAEHVSDYIL